MRINYKELKKDISRFPNETCKELRESLQDGHIAYRDFSMAEMWAEFYGMESYRRLNPDNDGAMVLTEDGGISGVFSTDFANIIGQLVYSKIMQAYQDPAFIGDQLCEVIPTKIKDTELVPGVGRIGDNAEIVEEGQLYPHFGLTEDYTTAPAKDKRGLIVPVTKEAVFFDKTNLVLKNAAEVGHFLGVNREKRILQVVMGITNNFNWLGTAYNTYYDAATSPAGAWINVHANPLVDWTDIDAAQQLFQRMRDPHTSEPIMVGPKTILVAPQLLYVARMVVNSTEIRRDNTNQRTFAANPLDPYPILTSEYIDFLGTAASWTEPGNCWWLGNFKKAFAYWENWPITISQAPTNSEADFNQDIIARFKASERGVAGVLDPRYVVRSCRECDVSSSEGEVPI